METDLVSFINEKVSFNKSYIQLFMQQLNFDIYAAITRCIKNFW